MFNISAAGSGYTSTMDSPDQSVRGILTGSTSIADNTLSIEIPKMGINYKGTFLPDSNIIKGSFTQGPVSLPLSLSRGSESKVPIVKPSIRPQDPTTFPYKQEEVNFPNAKAGNQTYYRK